MGFIAFAESVQILPDLSLVVHVLMILGMIWVLNRTFFRPINRVIAARSKGKGGENSETAQMLNTAAKKDQQYKDELLGARTEGYELIEKERTEAVKARQEKVAASKAETEAKSAADLEELAKQTDSARKAIDEEAKKLADEISSNILTAA